MSAEKGYVVEEAPEIAPDHELVGWIISMENLGPSYPIPVTLILFRCGKVIQRISTGQMIFRWSFVNNGRQVAVSSGTVHGMEGLHLTLYDSRTGKLLETWNGDETMKPPAWGEFVVR